MRVFQNIFVYPSYVAALERKVPAAAGFRCLRDTLAGDRYCAVHFLEPAESASSNVFLTSNAVESMQRAWAVEQGMQRDVPVNEIMLAQVESHESEVFYTQDPTRYGPEFLRRLPGCVKARVCWQSPPALAGDLRAYDLVLNNFPTSLHEYAAQGVRTAYFTPSFDPQMLRYGENVDRPIDVAFIGGYSRHHRNRAAVLEEVAALSDRHHIVFALDRSRMTLLAESPLGYVLPMGRHRRPAPIRAVAVDPVFGLEMYRMFSQSKIVLNGAVDSAGRDRGNMRCFEAMGCGALMVSDSGNYPEGMIDGDTMRVYEDAHDARVIVERLLDEPGQLQALASRAFEMIRGRYTKQAQWNRFADLASSL